MRAWDAYIQGNAGRTAQLRDGLAAFEGTAEEFDKVLAAALDTARVGHTRRFVAVRDRFTDDLQGLAEDFEATVADIAKSTEGDRRMVDLINEDVEARAIFRAVNKRYPTGYLATLAEEE